jgi:hypothetical protein
VLENIVRSRPMQNGTVRYEIGTIYLSEEEFEGEEGIARHRFCRENILSVLLL